MIGEKEFNAQFAETSDEALIRRKNKQIGKLLKQRDDLCAAAQDAEAFLGVMHGDENGIVPETVATPIGVPIKLRDVFTGLQSAILAANT